MKIGNVSLNPEAFKDYTKERFFEEYAGKLDIDKEIVWKNICEFNKKVDNESIGSTSKQSKKPDGNRINKGSSGE